MMTYLVLDSSVIVAALRESEENHKPCKKLLRKIKEGEFIALEPYIVLVEVVAAIKRRTGSSELAERVERDLLDIGNIYFSDLIKYRADMAADIAKETGVRGMDAIVIQIAKENDATLITLDEEMINKAGSIISIQDVDDLI
ncbi:MAG: type II toxin-antitoxin system VapC family toxin [Candidatus Altiarchaeota archaeon]|nr:type II toxin-antitoxin system VapC family toxin [Candidatus Altiarchaeota archaeon]